LSAAVAFLWLAAALYAAAGVLYMAFLVGAPAGTSRAARALLVAAFCAHIGVLGAHGVAGIHPVSSVGESIGFLAWIMVGGFLAAQWRRPLDAVGAFVSPVALVLLLIAYLSPEGGDHSTEGMGVLGRVHIGLASVGVSIFALATGLAFFYLVQERQLKRHKVGKVVKRGTALDTLDKLEYRLVQIGFPIFSIAMVAGAIWYARRQGGMRIEYPIALLAWGSFAALLIARHTAGWRGRRAALLTIVGFAGTVIVLGIYLARRVAEG
jgi:ABC-type uncharacterized transport system permease subunit